MPNYNVMGVAKAALEASVRYLAVGFRPAATSASTRFRPARSARWPAPASAMRARCSRSSRSIRRSAAASRWKNSAATALYLLSDLSGGVTGEIAFRRFRLQHHLDAAPGGAEGGRSESGRALRDTRIGAALSLPPRQPAAIFPLERAGRAHAARRCSASNDGRDGTILNSRIAKFSPEPIVMSAAENVSPSIQRALLQGAESSTSNTCVALPQRGVLGRHLRSW